MVPQQRHHGTALGKGDHLPQHAPAVRLAPVICLKFRGRKLAGKEADRVTKGALANYVVNTGPKAAVKGLEEKPQLAFALCYVAAHLVLDLVDEQTAAEIMGYCEGHLPR